MRKHLISYSRQLYPKIRKPLDTPYKEIFSDNIHIPQGNAGSISFSLCTHNWPFFLYHIMDLILTSLWREDKLIFTDDNHIKFQLGFPTLHAQLKVLRTLLSLSMGINIITFQWVTRSFSFTYLFFFGSGAVEIQASQHEDIQWKCIEKS